MVMRMTLLYGEIVGCQGYQKRDRFTKQRGDTTARLQYSGKSTTQVYQCISVLLKVHPTVFCVAPSALQREAGGYWA